MKTIYVLYLYQYDAPVLILAAFCSEHTANKELKKLEALHKSNYENGRFKNYGALFNYISKNYGQEPSSIEDYDVKETQLR